MKRVAIVGAGQSGLQLAHGLLAAGYEVSLFSDQSADEILEGRVRSSQCMFDSALEIAEGKAGIPMVSGAIAQFVCRKVKQYDGGDNVIFLGEVEEYKYNDGEPLVFHSGRYRIATRHPDIAD